MTCYDWPSSQWEVFAYIICLRKIFVFTLQALPLLRCPFYMSDFFGSHAPRVFPSLSLPSEGREVLGCPCVASRGFYSPARLGPAGGVEEPLVARSVHASSLLSPRFICGLAIQELLSCGGLLLPFLSRLVLPPHLCTLGEVVGRVSLPSAAPVRVLPGLLIFGLVSREGTLSPFLVEWLSCAVLLLMLSLRLPWLGCCGRGLSRLLFSLVRSLAVYGPLAVS